MARSLRYRRIKHPWFNAQSVQCRKTTYAHCTHFSHVKYTCLRNIVTPSLQRICVETRVFYPTISQRSCSVQHFTCSKYVAIHSIYNIQEFQAASSTQFCTVSKVFHIEKEGTVCAYFAKRHSLKWTSIRSWTVLKISYSLRIHCRACALKYECFIRRYRSNPAMCLPHSTCCQNVALHFIFDIQEF